MKNFGVTETGTTSRNKSIQLAIAAEPHTNRMQMRRSMPTIQWTDEKHRLYLKSMEASFVNQLYDSKERKGWSSAHRAHVSGPNLLMDALFNSTNTSGQFKILRGGCRRKMNYERSNTASNRANDRCEDIKSNTWIRHFRTSTKHPGLTSAPEDFTSRRFHFHKSQISQQNLFCSDTEISDQNFVDDVAEGEQENNGSSKKRKKSSMSDASGNEQIVPVSESSTTGDGGGGSGTEI